MVSVFAYFWTEILGSSANMNLIYFIIPFCFNLINPAYANIAGVINQEATGCLFGDLGFHAGFNARFFSYPYANSVLVSDTNYYATSYLTGTPSVYAYSVTEPQFSIPFTTQIISSAQLYGELVQISNTLIELTGYFYGKSYFL